MNISEISETSFDKKVSILSRINRVIDKISYGEKHDNLSMTLATLIDYGVVTDMNDKVLILVGSEFDKVLSHYGLEDTGFEEAWQIDPNLPVPDSWLPDDEEDPWDDSFVDLETGMVIELDDSEGFIDKE